jgi:hypothetical protein
MAISGLIAGSGVTSAAACGPTEVPLGEGAAWWSGSYSWGIRAEVDLEEVNVPAGRNVIHALFAELGGGNEYIQFGTYKGKGPGGECVNDNSKWTVFFLWHHASGAADCDMFEPDLDDDAQNVNFAMQNQPGVCFGDVNAWAFYFEGSKIGECIDFIYGDDGATVGAQAYTEGTGTNLKVDVHYYDLERRSEGTGAWHEVTGGGTCSDSGYQVRTIAADNRWLEDVP